MCLNLKSVCRAGSDFTFSFRRENQPKLLSKDCKELRSGTRYYYQRLDDGTIICGRFDCSGKWSPVSPELINDFFQLSGSDRLYPKLITVDQTRMGVLDSVMKSLCEQFALDSICEELRSSNRFEYNAC